MKIFDPQYSDARTKINDFSLFLCIFKNCRGLDLMGKNERVVAERNERKINTISNSRIFPTAKLLMQGS